MSVEVKEKSIETIWGSYLDALKRVYFPEKDAAGNPSITRFYLENGRLPHITDEIRPWRYRGWLIPYIQLCELHPAIPARWHYLLEILEAGKLIDKPIPHVFFHSEFAARVRPGLKQIEEMMRIVEYKTSTWNAFNDFCNWLGYACAVSSEPSGLSDDVQEQIYRKFDVSLWLLNATDYLGQFLCETRGGGWNPNAFYPTPITVVEMMCQILGGTGLEDMRHQKVHDPCVGTGRMPLVMSNYSLRLYGQDIDALCVLITKINFALYAPWGVCPVPDEFFPAEPERKIIAPAADTQISQKEKIYRSDDGQGLLFKL